MTVPHIDEALRSVGEMLASEAADARAGLGFLLREIATARPDLVRAEVARLDLERLGVRIR